MNYNYYQPYGYNQPFLNYNLSAQYPNQSYQQTNTNNIFDLVQVVQGEDAARAFQINPGSRALLLDFEKDTLYIKSVDFNGIPMPLRIFDFKERFSDNLNTAQVNQESIPYVTKKEFEERLSEIEELLK